MEPPNVFNMDKVKIKDKIEFINFCLLFSGHFVLIIQEKNHKSKI